MTYLRLGIGLLSGTLTITMMVLPTIIRTAEEAIKAVPVAMREGSLSLGATKLQTTFRIVVPAASPGILSGVILAIGRAAGETAALLFTLGTDYRLVEGFTSSARVLAVHLFFLVKEGLSTDKGFATATVLVLVILIVNLHDDPAHRSDQSHARGGFGQMIKGVKLRTENSPSLIGTSRR